MLSSNPTTITLVKTKDLILDEANHCRFEQYRTGPDGQDQFCLFGALVRAQGNWHAANDLLAQATLDLFPNLSPMASDPRDNNRPDYATIPHVYVNNYHPHADTIRVLDRAIELSLA
jgi:hypothetical protein